MELVFRLIDELRQETIGEITKPPEDKQSEFHFGRIHGQLFALGMLEERLKEFLENQSRLERQREREFD